MTRRDGGIIVGMNGYLVRDENGVAIGHPDWPPLYPLSALDDDRPAKRYLVVAFEGHVFVRDAFDGRARSVRRGAGAWPYDPHGWPPADECEVWSVGADGEWHTGETPRT